MAQRGLSPAIVFGLILIAFAAAFYIPVVVDDVDGTRQLAINQTEGEEIQVYHELNATLSDINSAEDNATMVLEDTNTRNTTEVIVEEAVEQSVSIESETILINATAIGTTEASVSYTYPVDYGWPTPMKTVAENLGMIMMALVAFLLLGWIWAA